MIDAKILALLRCPIEGGPLELAEDSLVRRVQAAIERGDARDRLDQRVSQRIEGGLVGATRHWLYPIRGSIPTLVAEEAIRVNDLTS